MPAEQEPDGGVHHEAAGQHGQVRVQQRRRHIRRVHPAEHRRPARLPRLIFSVLFFLIHTNA